MGLRGAALRILSRPSVVHRLPGRLRLRIPALRKFPKELSATADIAGALLAVPEEIESVKPNVATGSVLIRYDAARVTEKDVLEYVWAVVEIALRNRERLLAVPPERVPDVIPKLEVLLRGAMARPLAIDRRMEIPADALA